MRLVLIAPGWQAGRHAFTDEHPTTSVVAQQQDGLADRFGDEPDPASSWQAALIDELGLINPGGQIDDVPAAIAWREDTGRMPPPGVLLRADPIGLAPDRDSAVLQPPEALGLSAEESDSLLRDINAFIAEDGLSLEAGSPCRWYLAGAGLPLRRGPPPEALAFTRPDPGAPRHINSPDSDAERRLRRLGSELEMLLHEHPVNERRRARGNPVVSGLYFWGAAADWVRRDRSPVDDTLVTLVAGDDALTRCAATAAGVQCNEADAIGDATARIVVDLSMRTAWLQGNADALMTARNTFEQRELRPALEQFDAGELEGIVIRGDGCRRSLARQPLDNGGTRAFFARMLSRLKSLVSGNAGRVDPHRSPPMRVDQSAMAASANRSKRRSSSAAIDASSSPPSSA